MTTGRGEIQISGPAGPDDVAAVLALLSRASSGDGESAHRDRVRRWREIRRAALRAGADAATGRPRR
jgi:hypothetical protein